VKNKNERRLSSVTKIIISFHIGDKTISIEQELKSGDNLKEVIEKLLLEIEDIEISGKATAGQMRALYRKALDQGWSREMVKEFLEARIGTSNEDEIVGKVSRNEISRLIDEIGGAVEVSGKATVAQMRALWGKALDKGWSREKIRRFLEERLGTSREEEIVGKVDRDTLSRLIDELENL
jgi:hypothetical protein